MGRNRITLVALVMLLATQMFAVGEARITGKVVDPNDKPVAKAKIQISATEKSSYNETFESDAKGNFAAFLLDGTIRYKFVITAEGFATYEEVLKLKLVPERNEETFKLSPTAAASVAVATAAKADPSIVAYNEGVALYNQQKHDEAIAKFSEAIALNPELGQAYKSLALANAADEHWDKAIPNAEKAIELNGDDDTLTQVLSIAYEKTGNKAKAAEYRAKAPKSAPMLFNDAARLINAGKDADAEPLLKEAVTLDPNFALAWYELGMIYARLGKNAPAIEHLNKYIELDPKGKDVATAKEMIGYLK